jgi:mono/diheme cytochrome c family protein
MRSVRPGRWPCAIALSGLVLLSGCEFLSRHELPGKPNPDDRPVPQNKIVDFAQLYATNCASCHGADGRLGPAPPLDDPIFLAIVPDEELLRLVERGRTGTPMPGFSQRHGGPLTKEQVQALAEGIKPRWRKSDSSHEATALPGYAVALPPEAESAEAVARGEQVFAEACAKCHGTDGQGGDTVGPVNEPDFLVLASDQMLRRIIITGRPDLGMPDFAGTDGRSDDFHPLTSEQIDDLVALLAHWRTAPRGAKNSMAGTGQPSARRSHE